MRMGFIRRLTGLTCVVEAQLSKLKGCEATPCGVRWVACRASRAAGSQALRAQDGIRLQAGLQCLESSALPEPRKAR